MMRGGGGGHHHGGGGGHWRGMNPYWGYPYGWAYPYPAIVGEVVDDDDTGEVTFAELQKKYLTKRLEKSRKLHEMAGFGEAVDTAASKARMPISMDEITAAERKLIENVKPFIDSVMASNWAQATAQEPVARQVAKAIWNSTQGREYANYGVKMAGLRVTRLLADADKAFVAFDAMKSRSGVRTRIVKGGKRFERVSGKGPSVPTKEFTSIYDVPSSKNGAVTDTALEPGKDVEVAPAEAAPPEVPPLPDTPIEPQGVLARLQGSVQAHPVAWGVGAFGLGYLLYTQWYPKR